MKHAVHLCNDRLAIWIIGLIAETAVIGACLLAWRSLTVPPELLIIGTSSVTGILGFLGGRAIGRQQTINAGPSDTVTVEGSHAAIPAEEPRA